MRTFPPEHVSKAIAWINDVKAEFNNLLREGTESTVNIDGQVVKLTEQTCPVDGPVPDFKFIKGDVRHPPYEILWCMNFEGGSVVGKLASATITDDGSRMPSVMVALTDASKKLPNGWSGSYEYFPNAKGGKAGHAKKLLKWVLKYRAFTRGELIQEQEEPGIEQATAPTEPPREKLTGLIIEQQDQSGDFVWLHIPMIRVRSPVARIIKAVLREEGIV